MRRETFSPYILLMRDFLKQAMVVLVPGIVPLFLGWLGARWLLGHLWPEQAEDLFGWVVRLLTAVIFTLIFITVWAIFRDRLWHGLMHPIAFMGSLMLLVIALMMLPSLWKQLRLLAEGETAVARVTRLYTESDYDPETSVTTTTYHVAYLFETKAGESQQTRNEIPWPVYNRLAEEDDIEVTYLPERPIGSMLTERVLPQSRALLIFTLLFSVWAVMIETAVIQHFWPRGLESFLDRWVS